jgi:hypothetical protein
VSEYSLIDELRSVVEEEYRRIASMYEGCVESSGGEIDWAIMITYPEGVIHGLPAWYVKYVLSFREVVSRSYSIIFVVDGEEFELGRVDVFMLDGGCNIVKYVNEENLVKVAEVIEATE